MIDMCACGHPRNEHLVGFGMCNILECDCDQFHQSFELNIRTLVDDQGNARVLFQFQDSKLQLTSDAAVQIGLNLLSAAYAARGELALFTYCKEHDLDFKEILKLARTEQ